MGCLSALGGAKQDYPGQLDVIPVPGRLNSWADATHLTRCSTSRKNWTVFYLMRKVLLVYSSRIAP